jgi:hypothetical protein
MFSKLVENFSEEPTVVIGCSSNSRAKKLK